MSIDVFLNKLNKVTQKGNGKWLACCPVHNDKSPSLGIDDDNGVVLIHCFGCGASGPEVAEKLGIDISELFPPRENVDYENYKRQSRVYFNPGHVIDALFDEILISTIIIDGIIKDPSQASQVKDRLVTALSRISDTLVYINYKRKR